MLDENIVDGVLALAPGDDIYDGVPTFVTDSEDLIKTAGSYHCAPTMFGDIIQKYLSDKKIPTWIRHVVVPEITYKKEYLSRLGEFLAELKNLKALDVLPYHDMAVPKYDNLGLEYPLRQTPPLTKEEALDARNIIIQSIKKVRQNKNS